MSDFIIGGPNELDLSLLQSRKLIELPVHEAERVIKTDGLDETTIRQLISYADQLQNQEQYGGFNRRFVPGTKYGIDKLPKHKAFFDASKDYTEIYFSSGNRSGKSEAAAYAASLHLTGLYPDWWEGKRFRRANHGWALALTSAQTRDVIQTKLLGPIGSFGTGMIPKDLIVGTTTKSGAGGAIDILRVKHASGGVSTLAFKSTEQGRENLQGVTLDWAWMDELPPQDVYSEVFMRLMTTKGFIMVTATPLEGMTPLVFSFYSQADFLPKTDELPAVLQLAREDHQREMAKALKNGGDTMHLGGKNKAVIVAGWDDAPWLGEEEKITMLTARPAHLREASRTGLPGDTGGSVYPVPLSEILVKDFPIPGHYRLINGLDPSWNNTAATFGALDPDTDTLYIYSDYKRGQCETVIHAEAIKTKSKWKDAPVMIDPAGLERSMSDGKQALEMYRKHGLKIIKGDNNVEVGIHAVWERLSTGRLKVFQSCQAFQREYVTYSRDENGKIKKENDDVLDSVRYLVMGLKHARAPYMGEANTPFGKVKGNVSRKRYF